MRKLILATNNRHKAAEIQLILGNHFEIITLKEAGIETDIPEPHETLEENAFEKSSTIHKMTGMDCFAEDTGLLVDALKGLPGVHSARYAGEEKNEQDNINKLLQALEGQENRSAHFKTIVSLIIDGENHFFEGICKGNIAQQPTGKNGFGYDPIFIPEGSHHSFAEISLQEKSSMSHRKKAIEKMAVFLRSL